MKIRYDNNNFHTSFGNIDPGDVFRDDGAIFMKMANCCDAIVLSETIEYPIATEIQFNSYDEVELLDCELVIK